MLKRIREIYNHSKFSRNTAPKILSLIFALVFWIFVMDKVNPEMTRQIDAVPIELIGIQELEARGFEIMGERDFVVNVRIKGRRNEVISISKDDIQITADLGDLTSGLQKVPIEQKVYTEDITIVDVTKSNVIVDIDAIIRKPIDVVIQKEGNVPVGYLDEEMTISLQQVFVRGPESYVNTIVSMSGTLNISNMTVDVTKDLAISPIDINGETVIGVEVETNYVTVNIPISKVSTVLVEANYEGQVKEGFELIDVIISPSEVNVRGKREDINALKFLKTLPIDIANAFEDQVVKTSLEIPAGIELNQYLDDIEITFIIEEIITKEFAFDYSDITFINLDSPFRTNIADLEGQVILRVSAVESIVSDLSKSDIGLYIDAEEFQPGVVTAVIELNKRNDFNNIEILPNEIELTIYDINDVVDTVTEPTTEE